MTSRMTTPFLSDNDVITAIKKNHLKANIGHLTRKRNVRIHWSKATVDPGGTIFGPGPYLHVPLSGPGYTGTAQRVYAPAKLRRHLAARWIGFSLVNPIEPVVCERCGHTTPYRKQKPFIPR